VWVWVYLALFGDGEEGTDIETETTDQVGESAQKTSEEPDE
jgi:hypothetical protein